MCVVIVVTFYPIWYVLCASFSDANGFISHKGMLLWPIDFNFDGYKAMFKNCPNLEYYGENSVCLNLPAKNPKPYAYEQMFYGCTRLARHGTSSTLKYIDIQLESTTSKTLNEMFYNCNWLCGIKIGFIPSTTYLSTQRSLNWLYNVGSNRWEGGTTFICTPDGSNHLGDKRNANTVPTDCRIIADVNNI